MKAFLMFQDKDFSLDQQLPKNADELIQDLELPTLFHAMALEDEFLFKVAKKSILSGIYNDESVISYRQHILQDCLKHSSIIKEIYNIALEAIESRKKQWLFFSSEYPSSRLSDALALLPIFMQLLKKIRSIADENYDQFESEGFIQFFTMLKNELKDDYFLEVQNQLYELKLEVGVLIGAKLGKFNKGESYTLRKLQRKKRSWLQKLFSKKSAYTFNIHPRDEGSINALSELTNRGINIVSNVLAQSTDHILSFFVMLKTELAFYIGCLNLHETLSQIGMPVSFPKHSYSHEHIHSFTELYDVCLALNMKQKISSNCINADHKNLVIITGANQGGKSTFLRSIGLSQLMMQCGMFVPAESFAANICHSLFTHYQREEDVKMKSGKLDEELNRMSDIVDQISPNSMLLFNESFAATNESEGSEIARQIISALLENDIKIFFVTHLYKFSHEFYEKHLVNSIFLRAERGEAGERTFKLIEGEPLQTSYGIDLYNRIFNS